VIDVVVFGNRVHVIAPVAPVTAVPVAAVETTKTVVLGTRATVAFVRLKAAVLRPLMEILTVPAAIPCAAAVV
jgi:hypothetical protein